MITTEVTITTITKGVTGIAVDVMTAMRNMIIMRTTTIMKGIVEEKGTAETFMEEEGGIMGIDLQKTPASTLP
jgi:hypothetical protein